MAGYYVGLDLGKKRDYTALALCDQHFGSDGLASYAIRQLDRAVQVSYETVADKVAAFMGDDRLAGARLVVDETGVGTAVTDMLRRRGLVFKSVSITSGNTVRQDGDTWYVPKRELVSTVDVLLESARLDIPPHLPDAQTLARELRDFKYTISAAGYDSYGAPDWREGSHDDMVLAVALACWLGENPGPPKLTGGPSIAVRVKRRESLLVASDWAQDQEDRWLRKRRVL